MFCGHSSFLSNRGSEIHIARYRCHGWGCEHCRPKRQQRLVKEIIEGRPKRFLTLTIRRSVCGTPELAARALVNAWKRMREELQRKHKCGPIPFMAVFEAHKSGWPHMHIFLRGRFISRAWMSGYMERRLDSPNVDIRRIKNKKHAAAYVAGYVKKAPAQFKGCKRYWRNTAYIGVNEKKEKSKHPWEICRDSLEWLAAEHGVHVKADEVGHLPYIVLSIAEPP